MGATGLEPVTSSSTSWIDRATTAHCARALLTFAALPSGARETRLAAWRRAVSAVCAVAVPPVYPVGGTKSTRCCSCVEGCLSGLEQAQAAPPLSCDAKEGAALLRDC